MCAEGCSAAWRTEGCPLLWHTAGLGRWERWPSIVALALWHHALLLLPVELPGSRRYLTPVLEARAMRAGCLTQQYASLSPSSSRKCRGCPLTHLDARVGRQPAQHLCWAAGLKPRQLASEGSASLFSAVGGHAWTQPTIRPFPAMGATNAKAGLGIEF